MPTTLSENTLTHTWSSGIDGVGKQEWDDFFGPDGGPASYEFAKAVEDSALEGVDTWYLSVGFGPSAKMIAPCFSYRVRLDILTSGYTKKAIQFFTKPFPSLLVVPIFVVGSPLSTCCPPLASDDSLGTSDADSLNRYAMQQVRSKAVETGASLVVVKDISESKFVSLNRGMESEFEQFPSLPNCKVDLGTNESAYPSILRSKYRRRFRKIRKEVDSLGYRWDTEQEFFDIVDTVDQLYQNVYEKSETKFEHLNATFFAELDRNLAAKSRALVCRDSKGSIVATAIVIDSDDTLHALFIGLDYERIEGTPIYFDTIYRCIEEAQNAGKRYVSLGQTAYEPKAYAGSEFQDLRIGVAGTSRLWRFAVSRFFTYLFPENRLPEVSALLDTSDHRLETRSGGGSNG